MKKVKLDPVEFAYRACEATPGPGYRFYLDHQDMFDLQVRKALKICELRGLECFRGSYISAVNAESQQMHKQLDASHALEHEPEALMDTKALLVTLHAVYRAVEELVGSRTMDVPWSIRQRLTGLRG